MVGVNYGAHTDAEQFENPELFDPFRFSRVRKVTGFGNVVIGLVVRNKFGIWTREYAFPGRFLFDIEVQILLAYLAMNYDRVSTRI